MTEAQHAMIGRRFGKLTVLRLSDRRGSRGKRTVPLWECQCDCGKLTYKATDTLNSARLTMCADCAAAHAVAAMRPHAGYTDGTQLSRIRSQKPISTNTSGVRGVYWDKSSGKWRARLRFKGKFMNFGSYTSFDEAVKARRAAELEYYGEYLTANEPTA